jgi:hypothetical protein
MYVLLCTAGLWQIILMMIINLGQITFPTSSTSNTAVRALILPHLQQRQQAFTVGPIQLLVDI